MEGTNGYFNRANLTMLTDFYELTMGGGYFEEGVGDQIVYFDMFYRRNPDGGGFALMAGVEQLVDYLQNLSFSDEDIAYLRSKGLFSEAFLQYLRTFRFTSFKEPERTVQALREHEEILRLVAAKDYDGAVRATSVHLRDALEAYLKLWRLRKGQK